MDKIRFGLLSDIHISRKTYRLALALEKLRDVDVLLLAGDIANTGSVEEFDRALAVFRGYPEYIPVFAVSGNHDIPGNADRNYRAFERELLRRAEGRFPVDLDPSGAFHVRLWETVDLFGLNPLYHQKIFRFPDRGEQLSFLECRLEESPCPNHILLCPPPLSAHSPRGSRPYLPKEQDARLQKIVEAHPRILFLSGHTHIYPSIESAPVSGAVYLNDGSACPTQAEGDPDRTFPGNVVLFDVGETFTNFRVEFAGQRERERETGTGEILSP